MLCYVMNIDTMSYCLVRKIIAYWDTYLANNLVCVKFINYLLFFLTNIIHQLMIFALVV
jgi:hypothetical protein